MRLESLRESVIEAVAFELDESRSRIATAFAAGDFRGFDGDEGLIDDDGFHLERLGVEIHFDAHHVDHARGLDGIGRRYEAVLAQIDHVAARAPKRVRLTRDGDR